MAKRKPLPVSVKKEVTLTDVYLFDEGYKTAIGWVLDRIDLHGIRASDDMSVLTFIGEVEDKLKEGRTKPRKEAPRVD